MEACIHKALEYAYHPHFIDSIALKCRTELLAGDCLYQSHLNLPGFFLENIAAGQEAAKKQKVHTNRGGSNVFRELLRKLAI